MVTRISAVALKAQGQTLKAFANSSPGLLQPCVQESKEIFATLKELRLLLRVTNGGATLSELR